MRTKNVLRAAAVLWTAATMLGLGALPTGAAPFDKGHFHDVGSEPAPGFCGVADVRHDFDVRVSYRAVNRGREGFVHFADNAHGTEAYVNLATGKSFIHWFSATVRDTKITDDGENLTILVYAAGGERWEASDGSLRVRDPGRVVLRLVVDHNGTPTDPDDDVVVEDISVVRESTGLNEGHGRDFCEDFRHATD